MAAASRREAVPSVLRDDTTDPTYLSMLLFGGRSRQGGHRRYPGLADKIQKRITALYRIPRPRGLPDHSLLAAGGPAAGAAEPETDPRELHAYLSAWLGEEAEEGPSETVPPIAEKDLHQIVSRANGRASRYLKRAQRGGHIRRRDIEAVRDLCLRYIVWLKQACDHRRAGHGSVQICPDCGATRIQM